MKLNKTVNKVLTNKYVLYAVLFLAITNVLGYLMVKDFESLALFISLGLITSYFSKNMIIIMGVAMFGTNVVFASNKIREGFKEGVDATNTDVSGVVVSNVVANDGEDAKTQDNLPKPNNEIIFRKLDILDKRLKVIENRFEEFDNQ